ncbi:MAG: hypothetical protein IPH08_11065 [Rhodocyclaceae bacterium]|nr:hypothetical protein [Rhodocyclaceae bacterium]
MSMKWHRECLTNLKDSLQREEAELERVIARVERLRSHVKFDEQQIQDAADKRKDGLTATNSAGKLRMRSNVEVSALRGFLRRSARL